MSFSRLALSNSPAYTATTVGLGEFRMGCDAYGLVVSSARGTFRALEAAPVFVGNEDTDKALELSTCDRYLIVGGAFATYVLDLEDTSISLFKVTIRKRIRSENPYEDFSVWSEENPIYQKHNLHLNGKSGRHYFLQFPFVRDEDFNASFDIYHALRVRQILEARKAGC